MEIAILGLRAGCGEDRLVFGEVAADVVFEGDLADVVEGGVGEDRAEGRAVGRAGCDAALEGDGVVNAGRREERQGVLYGGAIVEEVGGDLAGVVEGEGTEAVGEEVVGLGDGVGRCGR